MSRSRRPYSPGNAFHLTSRLHGSAKLFDAPTRGRIVGILEECARGSDSEVLAYAIMPSHVHLVLRQQQDPLHRLMQPWICRIALMMRRQHGIVGHVFERRFRSRPCLSAMHVRDAIVYNHLNQVRAGLCGSAEAADCTSHGIYAGSSDYDDRVNRIVSPALQLFAAHGEATTHECRNNYLKYLEHRVLCDAADENGTPRPLRLPDTNAGDQYFGVRFTVPATEQTASRLPRPDLRDVAREAASVKFADLPLSQLKGSRLASAALLSLRNQIIRRAAEHGHPGVAIAAFFMMSPCRVSQITRMPA